MITSGRNIGIKTYKGVLLMKKLYICLSALLLVVTMFSGCKKDYSREAQKFGEEFLKNVYTFQDADKIIDHMSLTTATKDRLDNINLLMTEEAIKNRNNSIGQMPIIVALVNRSNLSVEKTELKQIKTEVDNNVYFFDYSITVKLTPLEDGKKTQTADLAGRIFILHDDKDYKVDSISPAYSNDWEALRYPENIREKYRQ